MKSSAAVAMILAAIAFPVLAQHAFAQHGGGGHAAPAAHASGGFSSHPSAGFQSRPSAIGMARPSMPRPSMSRPAPSRQPYAPRYGGAARPGIGSGFRSYAPPGYVAGQAARRALGVPGRSATPMMTDLSRNYANSQASGDRRGNRGGNRGPNRRPVYNNYGYYVGVPWAGAYYAPYGYWNDPEDAWVAPTWGNDDTSDYASNGQDPGYGYAGGPGYDQNYDQGYDSGYAPGFNPNDPNAPNGQPQVAQNAPARPPYQVTGGEMIEVSPIKLIFKDHRPPLEVHNYMLSRSTLTIMDKPIRSIPVNEIDVAATEAASRAQGGDFQLPLVSQ